MISNLLLYVTIISTLVYVYFVLRALLGLTRKRPMAGKKKAMPLSIIIPFRNESAQLPILQRSINLALKNAPQKVQIILINDHSSDGFKNTIPHFEVYELEENTGKKAAIDLGIQKAQHDRIVTFDADVELNPNFFKELDQAWSDEDLFILPVIGKGNAILEVESHAICALTMGSVFDGHTLLCNGAALGFQKSTLDRIEIRNKDLASGDDMFLLEALKKSGKSIGGVLHSSLIVSTQLPSTLSSFTHQRVRWASKSVKSNDLELLVLGLSTMLMYLCFITSFLVFGYDLFGIILAVFVFKLFIDYLLLFLFHIKTGINGKWWAYPILGIAYPLYSLYIGLMSILLKPKWKGRQI